MKELLWSILSHDAFWSVNKILAKNIGLEEAVFLSDLISKEKYFSSKEQLDDQGGFFNTTENLRNDLGISERSKKQIQANLIKLNIVRVKKRGVPAKNYWYLNHGVIIRLMSKGSDLTSQDDVDLTGKTDGDLTSQFNGDPAINKNKELKTKYKNKSEHLIENEIINYWNDKNIDGKAEPAKKDKRTFEFIRATINQYSEQELKSAIDEIYKDKWSIENKQVRLNRLIKPDKRDQNMHKYKGKPDAYHNLPESVRKKIEEMNNGNK